MFSLLSFPVNRRIHRTLSRKIDSFVSIYASYSQNNSYGINLLLSLLALLIHPTCKTSLFPLYVLNYPSCSPDTPSRHIWLSVPLHASYSRNSPDATSTPLSLLPFLFTRHAIISSVTLPIHPIPHASQFQ